MELITINWNGLLVLGMIAIIVELFFEWLFDMHVFDRVEKFAMFNDIKPWIVFGVSMVLCVHYQIDFFNLLFAGPVHWIGEAAAAGTIAGGSKQIMKMLRRYHDLGEAVAEAKKEKLVNGK